MSRLDPDGMRAFATDATSTGDTARRLEHAVADIIDSGSLTSGAHASTLLNEIADEAGLLAELCRTKAEQMELADIGLHMPSMATMSDAADLDSRHVRRGTATLTVEPGPSWNLGVHHRPPPQRPLVHQCRRRSERFGGVLTSRTYKRFSVLARWELAAAPELTVKRCSVEVETSIIEGQVRSRRG